MRTPFLIASCLFLASADKWEKHPLKPSDYHAEHTVRIELVQRNLDKVKAINKEVSNPTGPNFGQYLTNAEMRDLVGQPENVHHQIKRWVKTASFCENVRRQFHLKTRISVHGDYIFVTSTIARLQCLFHVEFMVYERDGKTTYRTKDLIKPSDLSKFQVPAHLRQYVQRIMHVGDLPVILRWQGGIKPELKGDRIDPNVIRKNYGVDGYTTPVVSGPQGTQAVGEFQFDYWYPSDLLQMQSDYDLPANNITSVIGKNNPSGSYAMLDEASLDVQYITTVQDIETWAFVEPGFGFDLVEYCEKVASTPNAPYVHSLSYGATETEYGTDNAYQANNEFMKLTTQGFTFLVASGDDGTGSPNFYDCPYFDPLFPATSPYVTAVGATYLETGDDNPQCTIYFSGSGFSNLFTREDYQDSAVEHYFSTESDLPSANLYNASGRGIPDLAAYGTNFRVLINGRYTLVGGTSASTPVVAALVAYGNAKRSQDGKAALGNINPRLYASGNVGTDINCGESKANECSEGFNSAEGWDPATGLGTPMGDVFFPLLTDN